MSNDPDLNDHAQRAADSLEAAAREKEPEAKRKYLDQAAVFAALDEQSRRPPPGDEGGNDG